MQATKLSRTSDHCEQQAAIDVKAHLNRKNSSSHVFNARPLFIQTLLLP